MTFNQFRNPVFSALASFLMFFFSIAPLALAVAPAAEIPVLSEDGPVAPLTDEVTEDTSIPSSEDAADTAESLMNASDWLSDSDETPLSEPDQSEDSTPAVSNNEDSDLSEEPVTEPVQTPEEEQIPVSSEENEQGQQPTPLQQMLTFMTNNFPAALSSDATVTRQIIREGAVTYVVGTQNGRVIWLTRTETADGETTVISYDVSQNQRGGRVNIPAGHANVRAALGLGANQQLIVNVEEMRRTRSVQVDGIQQAVPTVGHIFVYGAGANGERMRSSGSTVFTYDNINNPRQGGQLAMAVYTGENETPVHRARINFNNQNLGANPEEGVTLLLMMLRIISKKYTDRAEDTSSVPSLLEGFENPSQFASISESFKDGSFFTAVENSDPVVEEEPTVEDESAVGEEPSATETSGSVENIA